jgi:hypothetical protein
MIIGSCELEILIYEANSLKEKRHVIKSIIGKIQSRYNVSISEVGLQDTWRKSVIGFACVTNSTSRANSIVSNVLKFIENDGRVEIIDYEIEIL